ncbi:hypothetical protein [Tunicatimonas pelagia]|uniref:hypothetical protein n=1 Tax=Tunicatimonas pelagia TaxID=931531 RepID=UPI0026664C0F|nr:hypothetical protein [Tunicatimonas pelagia]WKN45888.1 hypothetical protein P0M28_13055 [Tunicatimonas pelagia]
MKRSKEDIRTKSVLVSKEGNFSRSSSSLLKSKRVRQQIADFAKVQVSELPSVSKQAG